MFDRVGIVPIAGLDGQQRQHRLAGQILELDVDIHLAEAIPLALVDREGDDKTVAVGGQLGDRRNHAKIGIPLGQIVFAQQLAIVGQPIGVVGVRGRQKAIPAAFLGFDDAAQRAVAELTIADEIDAAYPGRGPFVDLENEIDPVLRQLDDLGLHGCREVAVPPIEFENAPDIVLHARARIDDARTQLDLAVEVLVGELRIPLEGDAVDDRVLDHLDDQGVALADELDIGEEPGCEQRLQRAIDAFGIPLITRLDQQVRAHRLRLDPLDPLDPDIGDRATARHGRGRGRGGSPPLPTAPTRSPPPARRPAWPASGKSRASDPKPPTPTLTLTLTADRVRSRSASQYRRSRCERGRSR